MTAREKLQAHIHEARNGLAGMDCLLLPYYGNKLREIVSHLAQAVDFLAFGKTPSAESGPVEEAQPGFFCQSCGAVAFSASADPRVCPSCLVRAMNHHDRLPSIQDDVVAAYLFQWLLRNYSWDELACQLARLDYRRAPEPAEVAS